VLAEALIGLNIALGCVIWLPAWKKALKTRSTRDYSVPSFCMILLSQGVSLCVAILTGAWHLAVYFAVNGIIVAATLGLILRFRR